eukprot:7588302-Pyramimonas_sp.AAC.1
MHIVDTVLRRGLSSLPFFPRWLAGLKAIINFLRAYGDDIAKSIRGEFPAVADVVNKTKAPYFASWRWATLARA